MTESEFRLVLEVDAAHETMVLYRMVLTVLGVAGLVLAREWLTVLF